MLERAGMTGAVQPKLPVASFLEQVGNDQHSSRIQYSSIRCVPTLLPFINATSDHVSTQ